MGTGHPPCRPDHRASFQGLQSPQHKRLESPSGQKLRLRNSPSHFPISSQNPLATTVSWNQTHNQRPGRKSQRRRVSREAGARRSTSHQPRASRTPCTPLKMKTPTSNRHTEKNRPGGSAHRPEGRHGKRKGALPTDERDVHTLGSGDAAPAYTWVNVNVTLTTAACVRPIQQALCICFRY